MTQSVVPEKETKYSPCSAFSNSEGLVLGVNAVHGKLENKDNTLGTTILQLVCIQSVQYEEIVNTTTHASKLWFRLDNAWTFFIVV